MNTGWKDHESLRLRRVGRAVRGVTFGIEGWFAGLHGHIFEGCSHNAAVIRCSHRDPIAVAEPATGVLLHFHFFFFLLSSFFFLLCLFAFVTSSAFTFFAVSLDSNLFSQPAEAVPDIRARARLVQ
jgi:hypothetical protein